MLLNMTLSSSVSPLQTFGLSSPTPTGVGFGFLPYQGQLLPCDNAPGVPFAPGSLFVPSVGQDHVCFHPKDLRERLKIQDNLVFGLPDKMKLDIPSSETTDSVAYSITRAIGELILEVERCSLKPFRIVLKPHEEIFLLENWGSASISDVKYLCVQRDNTGSEFEPEDLRLPAINIKGSFGMVLSARVATVAEDDTHGPIFFKMAVGQVASLCAAKVRKLTNDLQGLSIKDIPALVPKLYTTGTDTGFNLHAWGVYNSISRPGFDSRPLRDIAEVVVVFYYEQQVQLDLYVPALGNQSIHGLLLSGQMACQSEIKFEAAQESRGDGSAPGSTLCKAGTDTTRKCCNRHHANGHLAKDWWSQMELDPLHTPPNTKKEDSRERVRDGSTESWCGRCCDGKEIWTKGLDVHFTEAHPELPEVASDAPAVKAQRGVIEAPFHFGVLWFITPSTGVPSKSSAFMDGVLDYTLLGPSAYTSSVHNLDKNDEDPAFLMHPNEVDGKLAA